jgi:hypothetical protein
MFPLAELPGELFNEVIAFFLETANLPDLFRARAVCRAFAAPINHHLLSNIPLKVFETYHESARPTFQDNERGTYKFLDANAETLLFNHAKASTEPDVVKGLNDLVKELLGFSSEEDNTEELRDQYLRDLSRSYRSNFWFIDTELTRSFVADIMPTEKLMWYTLQKLESMQIVREEERQEVVSTLLAAAAAVGNANAVACYLALGGDIFEQLEIFSSPIAGAACTGKSEILRMLLGEVKQDVLATSSTHCGDKCRWHCKVHWLFWNFTRDTRLVVNSSQTETAMILIKFMQENFPRWLLDEQEPYFVQAMRTSSLDMVKLLIEAESSASHAPVEVEYTTSKDPVEAEHSTFDHDDLSMLARFASVHAKDFLTDPEKKQQQHRDVMAKVQQKNHMLIGAHAACVAGRTDIVQYLLEQRHIAWTTLFHTRDSELVYTPEPATTIALAAQYGHRALINLYVKQGNTIAPCVLNDALSRPLGRDLYQTPTPVFLMVQHLISIGAVVDEETLHTCEGRTGRIQVCLYKPDQHCYITDGAMTATLLAHEAMKHLPRETLQRYGSIKLLLRKVANGKVKVPTEPMPFLEMAKEVLEWLRGPSA